MESSAFRAVIRGEVQWVGFRAFTERQAGRLGLTGFVRNLPDSAVEVVAEGDEASLKLLLEALHLGPRAARVEEVSITWQKPTGKYKDFLIRY
jgi:acylphosphatase